MKTVAVLKRKDASSIVAAVVLAMIVWTAVSGWAARPAAWLSGLPQGGGWRVNFWRPLFTLIVGLIILELVVWLYTWLMETQGQTRR